MCIILVQRLKYKPFEQIEYISIYTNNEMNWIDQNDGEEEEEEEVDGRELKEKFTVPLKNMNWVSESQRGSKSPQKYIF